MTTPCPSIPLCCENPFDYALPGTPWPPVPTGAPVVTSATINLPVGEAMSYQIEATNSPTGYGASGMPLGLLIDGFTGVVSGTIADDALLTYIIEITASNEFGTGYGTLTINVVEDAPIVTSGSASIGNSAPFSYQIIATNSPSAYNATGLPTGLSVNPATGLISGTATGMTVGHVYTIPISATNATGTGNGILTLTVATSYYIYFDTFPTGTFLQEVLVSQDGSAYAVATAGTHYYAISQFKYKVTGAPGSYTPGNELGPTINVYVSVNFPSTLPSTVYNTTGNVSGENCFALYQLTAPTYYPFYEFVAMGALNDSYPQANVTPLQFPFIAGLRAQGAGTFSFTSYAMETIINL